MNRYSADRVVDVELVVEKPYAEYYEQTIVAVVAQNTRLNTKLEKLKFAYEVKRSNPGLPYLIHVKIMQATVATAGAMVVVRKMEPSCSTEVAAAPLKPYQPSQRINTPSAPSAML